jgi:hypothetical protein
VRKCEVVDWFNLMQLQTLNITDDEGVPRLLSEIGMILQSYESADYRDPELQEVAFEVQQVLREHEDDLASGLDGPKGEPGQPKSDLWQKVRSTARKRRRTNDSTRTEANDIPVIERLQ